MWVSRPARLVIATCLAVGASDVIVRLARRPQWSEELLEQARLKYYDQGYRDGLVALSGGSDVLAAVESAAQ
jgi:hypothetical protein